MLAVLDLEQGDGEVVERMAPAAVVEVDRLRGAVHEQVVLLVQIAVDEHGVELACRGLHHVERSIDDAAPSVRAPTSWRQRARSSAPTAIAPAFASVVSMSSRGRTNPGSGVQRSACSCSAACKRATRRMWTGVRPASTKRPSSRRSSTHAPAAPAPRRRSRSRRAPVTRGHRVGNPRPTSSRSARSQAISERIASGGCTPGRLIRNTYGPTRNVVLC